MLDLDRPHIDWVSIARGHGVPGQQVSNMEDFAQVLRIANKEKGPRLIELVM
jgi:acetolactate synthase-1/2/3 large subunit